MTAFRFLNHGKLVLLVFLGIFIPADSADNFFFFAHIITTFAQFLIIPILNLFYHIKKSRSGKRHFCLSFFVVFFIFVFFGKIFLVDNQSLSNQIMQTLLICGEDDEDITQRENHHIHQTEHVAGNRTQKGNRLSFLCADDKSESPLATWVNFNWGNDAW